MEDRRANPFVETATGLKEPWAGTASNGCANLTVIATSGPARGQRSYLMAIGLAFVARRAGTGSGAAAVPLRVSLEALPNTLFVGCAQGFNKRLMDFFCVDLSGDIIIYSYINSLI